MLADMYVYIYNGMHVTCTLIQTDIIFNKIMKLHTKSYSLYY